MTNSNKQLTGYVSTRRNWFNPHGTAHYAPVAPQPNIYTAINNTLEQIIAGNVARVAKLEALLKEKRGLQKAEEDAAKATEEEGQSELDIAITQHRDEELADLDRRQHTQSEAATNHQAEDERKESRIETSSQAAAQADYEATLAICHIELKKWGLQRNTQMDSKATFDAFYSRDNKLCPAAKNKMHETFERASIGE